MSKFQRWDIYHYWLKNASVVAHIPGNFIRVVLKRLSFTPEHEFRGASVVRWGGVGVERRLENCPGVRLTFKELAGMKHIQDLTNPIKDDDEDDDLDDYPDEDSPGIDCNGHPSTAHVGAAFDAQLPPPLYVSLPQISEIKTMMFEDDYLYNPDKANRGQSKEHAPGNVAFESFTAWKSEEDFETYADAHVTTGMVLDSQVSWQLNLRIAHGPNRSVLYPYAIEALLPLVVVRDRTHANDDQLAQQRMYEAHDSTLTNQGVYGHIFGRIFILGALIYLRGPKAFWSVLFKEEDVYKKDDLKIST